MHENDVSELCTSKDEIALCMTKTFVERLKERIKTGNFPTHEDVIGYKKRIKKNPEDTFAIIKQIDEVINDIKELLYANSDYKMANYMENQYNKKVKQIRRVMMMAAANKKEMARIEQEKANKSMKDYKALLSASTRFMKNILACCTINIFDEVEYNAYFANIIRIIEAYNPEMDGRFTEEDIAIIAFLRFEKELEEAQERARTGWFIEANRKVN